MATVPPERIASDCYNARTRSFGGCTTCRARHVKCDERKPTCSTCNHLGLTCGGYEKGIFFGDKSNITEGIVRFRRPLLTEQEREHMSKWLTTTVPPYKTARVLSQLEDHCEKVGANEDLQLNQGPFGVFRVRPLEHVPVSAGIIHDSSDLNRWHDFNQANEECAVPHEDAICLEVGTLLGFPLPQLDQDMDLFSPDFPSMHNESDLMQQYISDNEITNEQTHVIEHSALTAGQQDLDMHPNQQLVLNIFPQLTAHDKVPQYTVILLKHYTTTVLSSLTACTHTKTPWHILFLPHAKECLAALTLGEDLNHASLSSLYGMLAMSAFSLGGIFQSDMWSEYGKRYRQQAREHIRRVLKAAYDKSKIAKYKTILMALLTMIQLSNAYGHRDQTECYLLEAEKLIRLKGLNRRKSRKVRLLHHCYAFARLFHESTFIGSTDSLQRNHVRQAVENSGIFVPGQDSMSFSHIGWKDLDRELVRIKGTEEGENDLHLEKPGIFTATLYHEIYGVPEQWMSLLSQVIRLANEKEKSEHLEVTTLLTLKDFSARAKALERCIKNLRWKLHDQDVFHDQHQLKKMLDGMNSALAIYFYRRVYDLDASLLQDNVKAIRTCLSDCEEEMSSVVYYSAGFQWSAFIAACEAQNLDDQQWFSKWFKNGATFSGASHLTDLLENVEYVWQEKSRPGGTNITWVDLTRNNTLFRQRT